MLVKSKVPACLSHVRIIITANENKDDWVVLQRFLINLKNFAYTLSLIIFTKHDVYLKLRVPLLSMKFQ